MERIDAVKLVSVKESIDLDATIDYIISSIIH